MSVSSLLSIDTRRTNQLNKLPHTARQPDALSLKEEDKEDDSDEDLKAGARQQRRMVQSHQRKTRPMRNFDSNTHTPTNLKDLNTHNLHNDDLIHPQMINQTRAQTSGVNSYRHSSIQPPKRPDHVLQET